MELQINHHMTERRPIGIVRPGTSVRWFKEWVPQEVATGGKCLLLKWVTEDMLIALEEKSKETEAEEQKNEPATEVLFLCSYEGCGKTFIDAGALRKHSHIHGEKQHICQFEGCGKKFLDSSKLKRHYLIHTGERDYVCPHEGCGKAFSLDFNLRAHMRTHSLENYHVCPYPECAKRFTNESKLRTHVKTHNEKTAVVDTVKHTAPAEKPHTAPKTTAAAYASVERPYVCPYDSCEKAYIHEYKLNLHLRREHPGHNAEENGKPAAATVDHAADETSDQELFIAKAENGKNSKRSKPSSKPQPPPAKVRKASTSAPASVLSAKKQWPPSKEMHEEDSEETEEDRDNDEEDGWRYQEVANGDDEETEDEE